jgi:phosphate-selective porin OprO/OprP
MFLGASAWANEATTKWKNGIEFTDEETNSKINLRFRMQNRADFRFLDVDQSPTADLQVRRMRLRLNGHLLDPKLKFALQLGFSRRDMDWDGTGFPGVLRDAMIIYELTNNWTVSFGQGKLPGNRQRVVSSGDQQFVDRSIVNAAFNIDRDFGAQSQYLAKIGDQAIALKGAISSGESRNQITRPNKSLFYTGRVEWLPFGEFTDNGDNFESDLAFEPNWKVALGYTISSMPNSARANGTVGEIFTVSGIVTDTNIASRSQLVQFADFLAKYQGLSIYAEYARRSARLAVINSTQAVLVGQGYNLQVGKLVTDKIEVAMRHSAVLPEGQILSYHPLRKDFAVVVNHFLNRHRVKLQGELGRLDGVETYLRLQFELGI